MTGFVLDPRLEADTQPVCDLGLCTVRLMDDANYPWLIVVPRRSGLVDLIDVAPEERALLTTEIDIVSRALLSVTACDKLNVASLGNQVRQLHVHVIARFESDAAWPGPIWGKIPAKPYSETDRHALIEKLKGVLV
ncbi:MAG: HIT family protein [Pseudomonadota bacterium]